MGCIQRDGTPESVKIVPAEICGISVHLLPRRLAVNGTGLHNRNHKS